MICRNVFPLQFYVVCSFLAYDCLFISFSDASGVGTDDVSAYVMEGDSITLHTDVETNQQEEFVWYFNDTRIAQISGDLSKICKDFQCKEIFRDRLRLDHQTGSLTITDTRTTDSGEYKLVIISSSSTNSKISGVAVHGESYSGIGRLYMLNREIIHGLSTSCMCFYTYLYIQIIL